MKWIADVLAAFSSLSMDHINALIALTALGVAGLAVFIALTIVRKISP